MGAHVETYVFACFEQIVPSVQERFKSSGRFLATKLVPKV